MAEERWQSSNWGITQGSSTYLATTDFILYRQEPEINGSREAQVVKYVAGAGAKVFDRLNASNSIKWNRVKFHASYDAACAYVVAQNKTQPSGNGNLVLTYIGVSGSTTLTINTAVVTGYHAYVDRNSAIVTIEEFTATGGAAS